MILFEKHDRDAVSETHPRERKYAPISSSKTFASFLSHNISMLFIQSKKNSLEEKSGTEQKKERKHNVHNMPEANFFFHILGIYWPQDVSMVHDFLSYDKRFFIRMSYK